MAIFLAILQLLYATAIILVPVCLYKRRNGWLMRFYSRMAFHASVRKSYMLMLAILVLLQNFLSSRTQDVGLWLLPGFLYGLLLLRYKLTDAMLRWLHDDKVVQLLGFALVLFSMTLPQLYSLSMGLALTLLAAMFYPSSRVIRMTEHLQDYPEFCGTEEEVFKAYF